MGQHGEYGSLVIRAGRLLCGMTAVFVAAGMARAECRLALVLGLDVSSSVDAVEYDLQRVGLAAALNSRAVRGALLNGASGDVALSVFEWSGFYQHKLQLDWSLLNSETAIDAAVRTLARMERSHDDFPTAVGQALGYGAGLLERGPDCARRVIDISGDGVNNYGFPPAAAYRNFPFQDVTVNGLVILGHDAEVLRFYREEIARGPASFVLSAQGFEDFEAAMTRKLFREINEIVLGRADGLFSTE